MTKSEVRRLLRQGSDYLTSILLVSKSSFALFMCLWIMVLVYRIQLTVSLFTNTVRPFDFNPAQHPVWFALAYWPYDLGLVIACFLISWLLSRLLHFIHQGRAFGILNISGLVLLQIILMITVLVHGIHGKLLFDVQTGFDTSVVKEAFSGISFVETLKLIEARDYLFLLFPFGIFWLVFVLPRRVRIWMAKVSMVSILFLLLLSVLVANERSKNVPDEIGFNPALFLASDVAENLLFKPSAGDQTIDVRRGNGSSAQVSRHMEKNSKDSKRFLPAKSQHPWNIVFIIMESVGTRYIFDSSHGNPMPMPFLHKISKEGWYLKKHFTTSNVSTKAVFSLFSGLYDFFNRETFGTRPDAEVPAISDWVGEGYDRFLVTPSSISWYFPERFVKNSGLSEVHSYENLTFEIKEEFHSLGHYIARDEIQTMDFFIRRLSKAQEPFLGVYISFAAHFPYFDYGEDYRIMKDDGGLTSRYYNNLNLLDHMIKRVYDHLKEQGRLERTILVIVGDHGQAFGQHHSNNFMHYRYSYNENLETPAILYQPALFKPRVFEFPTSHVDILPTLLDAIRIPYPSTAFDGGSLFNYKLKRDPLYFYGYEESISSLSSDLIKVQYSLKRKRCWAFDLKLDPEEKNPLDCSLYPLQAQVLLKCAADHDARLLKYNATLIEKKGLPKPPVTVGKEAN
ncbi:MAG TPA: LTA synthase family protein [Thermodesulfobacteriota bacterium]|nr:LTA synthase family protein [Thermodesulfobacteriota bacterium]